MDKGHFSLPAVRAVPKHATIRQAHVAERFLAGVDSRLLEHLSEAELEQQEQQRQQQEQEGANVKMPGCVQRLADGVAQATCTCTHNVRCSCSFPPVAFDIATTLPPLASTRATTWSKSSQSNPSAAGAAAAAATGAASGTIYDSDPCPAAAAAATTAGGAPAKQ